MPENSTSLGFPFNRIFLAVLSYAMIVSIPLIIALYRDESKIKP
jgi:hypothetical protein